MKPLAIAFHQKPSLSKTGLIAILFSCVMLGVSLVKYMQFNAIEKTIDKQIAMLDAQKSQYQPQISKFQKIDQQSKQAIDETAQFLMYSWAPLFSALEEAQTVDVAILSIMPDHINHTLVLALESKNRTAMFDYVKKLQTNNSLHNVHLSKHQVLIDVEDSPVQFEIEANID
jgi:hypothetical protein